MLYAVSYFTDVELDDSIATAKPKAVEPPEKLDDRRDKTCLHLIINHLAASYISYQIALPFFSFHMNVYGLNNQSFFLSTMHCVIGS